MKAVRIPFVLFVFVALLTAHSAHSQCTALGQNPSTAFPVCGTTVFQQTSVPLCSSHSLYVPGCPDGAAYENRNPYWYKFTCYTAGSLGFTITPSILADDYDWQLYDITGLDPDDVYTNRNIVVTGNWSGSSGPTGASSTGVNFIQCASDPATNVNTFSSMPNLVAGHEYLLLVSHYTNSQSGYSLSFSGGTAVITDPKEPHLSKVIPDCDGRTLTVIMNKKLRCTSLSAGAGLGSEFSVSAPGNTVTSVTSAQCINGFDFDTLTVTLANPLPPGDHQLVINNGTDGNTLTDICNRSIPQLESVTFRYDPPVPIFADSIGKTGCAPNQIKVYFPKRIECSTIAPDGSDFTITGPSPVAVTGARGENCSNGRSYVILLQLSAPIEVGGNYTVLLKTGNDGGTITDECGLPSPTHTRNFQAADVVSATYNYTTQLGCRQNTLSFSHDGANNVNSWNWSFNTINTITTQNHSITFPASSTNTVQLIVSNGVCSDTASETIVMDNEVKTSFTMAPIICPEDLLEIKNTSAGLVDQWTWTFGNIGNSQLKDPAPVKFPETNIEATYVIKLVAQNNSLNCKDSTVQRVKVLNNCFIAVPSAFTPNNDGLNDFLYPNNAIKAENLDFKIFNRWGQLVFHSKEWTRKWDGKVNGIEQGTGVYVWMLEYTHRDTKQKVFQKGTTTLIR
ncbi:gliding motility-associated C-terminal domain-containing protein [Terrimonas sp. NA20]|uniref:Gliding motility-associated C-terminal domain-containing protein n=1 Tax=Terrimonas ginsenosidimutans TaxID=2908004 RepID=A0ABS9KXS3_9BACT|nr:gliding motility-associated C-terminal domain-containing protein [Terrimonas ginsenosidimutans]MCG2617123.1 gliding motility-associated C-terminal domain-containing protein [Terrimonas ginsenosidimutans]